MVIYPNRYRLQICISIIDTYQYSFEGFISEASEPDEIYRTLSPRGIKTFRSIEEAAGFIDKIPASDQTRMHYHIDTLNSYDIDKYAYYSLNESED